jgi:hypothetical protein
MATYLTSSEGVSKAISLRNEHIVCAEFDYFQ